MTNSNAPEEFNRALSEGAWLLRQNRPDDALERLLPLYASAPNNPDVAINVGGAYILQAKWNKAVSVLSKAAELHPDNVMIWVNLGAAYLGRLPVAGPQQQTRAIRAYEKALALDPKAPNVHYHLGLIHKERNDFDRAAEYFEGALAVNPGDNDARYWLKRLAQIQAEQAAAAAATAPATALAADPVPEGATSEAAGTGDAGGEA